MITKTNTKFYQKVDRQKGFTEENNSKDQRHWIV